VKAADHPISYRTLTDKAQVPNAAFVKRGGSSLPGITVHVTSDAGDMSVTPVDGHLNITHREATRFELRFESNRR
jgi:hypothetical protein